MLDAVELAMNVPSVDDEKGVIRRRPWSLERSVLWLRINALSCACLPISSHLSVAVFVFLIGTSLASIVLNNILFSYDFQCTFTITSMKHVLSLLCLFLVRATRKDSSEIQAASSRLFSLALPMAVCGALNIPCAMFGLQLLPAATYACLRRLGAPVIVVLDYVIRGNKPKPATQMAALVLALGNLLAVDAVEGQWLQFAFTMLNNAIFATFCIMQKKMNDDCSANPSTIIYHYAILALPITIVFAFAYDEPYQLITAINTLPAHFWLLLFFSCAAGALFEYAMAMSNVLTSPLTTMVGLHTRDLIVALGSYILNTTNYSIPQLLSFSVVFSAIVFYAQQELAAATAKSIAVLKLVSDGSSSDNAGSSDASAHNERTDDSSSDADTSDGEQESKREVV